MIVRFSDMAAGGDAVGRDENGRVVFAPYAAPGETGEVEIVEETKKFARGRLLRVLEAETPHNRVEPPCPYFLPESPDEPQTACGGCQIQHLSTPTQLDTKRRMVVEALQRVGGFAGEELDVLVRPTQSAAQWHYRNKADFVVGSYRDTDQSTLIHIAVGFNARQSHSIVDIAECPIQHELNNKVLWAVREAVARRLAAPFDAESERGVLRRVVARTSSSGEVLVVAVTTREHWPQVEEFVAFFREQVPELIGVLRREPRGDAKPLWGRDWLEETVGDLTFRVTGEGFFQINTSLVPALVQEALGALDVQKNDRVLDLFCGVGLFSLFAAQRIDAGNGGRVLGIESGRQAARDARDNARRHNLSASFIAGDAAHELAKMKAGAWDKVLLDPPRDGARECMPHILRLRPQSVVYVSCDAATLARDLKVLSGAYRLVRVTPFDLFPQTSHVETIAVLQRREL